jgi:hypothetical protein
VAATVRAHDVKSWSITGQILVKYLLGQILVKYAQVLSEVPTDFPSHPSSQPSVDEKLTDELSTFQPMNWRLSQPSILPTVRSRPSPRPPRLEFGSLKLKPISGRVKRWSNPGLTSV